jgi:deoxyribodipyrimidine photolyase
LPELDGQDLKSIHNPLENNLDYIKPIVDHKVEQKVARALYK